jgi:aryl-alcohol dehydrogenase-like predicted oxidoreductase
MLIFCTKKGGFFLKKKKLGNSDLEITAIGYGAWAIGGSGWEYAWGEQDDNDSVKAIHKSLEMGVNWIDTAAAYGLGHSEEVVQKAVKEWDGEKPYIFTKCGLVGDDKGKVRRVLKPESIREECENSLRRLKTDAIDLYQIHWPPFRIDDQIYAAWEMMTRLKDEGKVKWIGVSNFNVKQIIMAEEISPVTSLQPPYSLIKREIEDEILPYCFDNNIGVIVYSPMYSGLLTGKMTKERITNMPEDDWRRNDAEFNEPKLKENLQLVELLKELASKYNSTPGEIAVAWTLLHQAVTASIVGARNEKQASEVMRAWKIQLSEEDIEQLNSFRSKTV